MDDSRDTGDKLTNLEDFLDIDMEIGEVKAYFHVSGLCN